MLAKIIICLYLCWIWKYCSSDKWELWKEKGILYLCHGCADWSWSVCRYEKWSQKRPILTYRIACFKDFSPQIVGVYFLSKFCLKILRSCWNHGCYLRKPFQKRVPFFGILFYIIQKKLKQEEKELFYMHFLFILYSSLSTLKTIPKKGTLFWNGFLK